MKIYLIGFMGSGKSFLGKAAAQSLSLNFIDLDTEIENNFGKITTIFEKSGEDKFRQFEFLELKKTAKLQNCIIACGGGVVTFEQSFDFLQKQNVIFLDENFEICWERIKKTSRPLVTKNSKQNLFKKWQSRYSLYTKCAKKTIKNPSLEALKKALILQS